MFLSKFILAALALGAVNALPATTIEKRATDNSNLIAKLKTDPTAVKQFQDLLSNNGKPLSAADQQAAAVYDFNKNRVPIPGTQGGSLNNANGNSFPILEESGLSLNLLTLGPCGIFAPHTHPRANEFFLVLDGQVNFGFELESGVFGGLADPNPPVQGTLSPQEGTLFPMGSVHWQMNASPTCNNATTFEAFSSDDAGALIIVNKIANDSRTVSPTDHVNDLQGLRAVLPPSLLAEVDSCLARCNIHGP